MSERGRMSVCARASQLQSARASSSRATSPLSPPPCARSGLPPPLPPNLRDQLPSAPRRHRCRRSAPRAITTSAGVVVVNSAIAAAGSPRPRRRPSPSSPAASQPSSASAITRRSPTRVALRDQRRAPRAWPAAPAGRAACVCCALHLALQPLDRRRQLLRRDRQMALRRGHRVAPLRGSARARGRRTGTRRAMPPRNFSQPPIAMMPMRAGARDVRAAARRQVEVVDVDQAQRAGARRLLPQRQRRGFFGASQTGCATGRSSQTIAIGLVFRLRRFRPATPRAPDRWSPPPRPGGSSRCARRTADRTPPTARAGRCAAACDRSAAPSRSRRATRVAGLQRPVDTTWAIVPSSRSITSMTAAPPSVPVSNGWPPDVG